MLLDDLTGVIELLRERIQSHGEALRENETRTRMALVDPLLQALGWDVSDPAVVTPEFKVSGGWADYALLRSDGPPAATVEAKKLGEPLASHQMQMLNYANASGIDFAALTDGETTRPHNSLTNAGAGLGASCTEAARACLQWPGAMSTAGGGWLTSEDSWHHTTPSIRSVRWRGSTCCMSLLSGYKSNKVNWLQRCSDWYWELILVSNCKISTFSNSETVKICRISARRRSTCSCFLTMATST